MKPCIERLRRAVAQIEVRLDLVKPRAGRPDPNIDAAIGVLKSLADELKVPTETPIDLLGLDHEAINELEESGIETVEQLLKMTPQELLATNRIGVKRLLEIESCLEIWKIWEE